MSGLNSGSRVRNRSFNVNCQNFLGQILSKLKVKSKSLPKTNVSNVTSERKYIKTMALIYLPTSYFRCCMQHAIFIRVQHFNLIKTFRKRWILLLNAIFIRVQHFTLIKTFRKHWILLFNMVSLHRTSEYENFWKPVKKKVPLACNAPPVKSRHFCPKHMTYQNHRIFYANVWVPSIYHNYLR